jgi:hypothetical protein
MELARIDYAETGVTAAPDTWLFPTGLANPLLPW